LKSPRETGGQLVKKYKKCKDRLQSLIIGCSHRKGGHRLTEAEKGKGGKIWEKKKEKIRRKSTPQNISRPHSKRLVGMGSAGEKNQARSPKDPVAPLFFFYGYPRKESKERSFRFHYAFFINV